MNALISGFNSVMTKGGVIPRQSVLDKRKRDASRRTKYQTSLMPIGESTSMSKQPSSHSSVSPSRYASVSPSRYAYVSQIQDDDIDMLSGLVNRINLHSSDVNQDLEDDIDMLTNLVSGLKIKAMKKKRKATHFTRVKKTKVKTTTATLPRVPRVPRKPKVPKEDRMEYSATPSRSSTRPKTKPERLTYIR